MHSTTQRLDEVVSSIQEVLCQIAKVEDFTQENFLSMQQVAEAVDQLQNTSDSLNQQLAKFITE